MGKIQGMLEKFSFLLNKLKEFSEKLKDFLKKVSPTWVDDSCGKTSKKDCSLSGLFHWTGPLTTQMVVTAQILHLFAQNVSNWQIIYSAKGNKANQLKRIINLQIKCLPWIAGALIALNGWEPKTLTDPKNNRFFRSHEVFN